MESKKKKQPNEKKKTHRHREHIGGCQRQGFSSVQSLSRVQLFATPWQGSEQEKWVKGVKR